MAARDTVGILRQTITTGLKAIETAVRKADERFKGVFSVTPKDGGNKEKIEE